MGKRGLTIHLPDERGQRHESIQYYINLFHECIAASDTYRDRPELFVVLFFQALSSFRVDPVLRTLYRHWPLNRFGYKIYQRRITTVYRPDPFLELSRELGVDLCGGPGDEPVAKMWKQKVDGAKKDWRAAGGCDGRAEVGPGLMFWCRWGRSPRRPHGLHG